MVKRDAVMGAHVFSFAATLATMLIVVATLYSSHVNGGVLVTTPLGEAPVEIFLILLGVGVVCWLFSRTARRYINGGYV